MQGGERADDRVEAGDGVGQADADPGRRPVRVAGQVPQPADRLRHTPETGPVTVGAGLPVARDTGEDHAGVDLAHLLDAQPPALQRAGPEVLQHDVAAADQPQGYVPALRVLQVQGEGALVPVHRPEQQRCVALVQPPAAQFVAAGRPFHLDDVRAEVGHQPARGGGGDEVAQFHHAQARQGPRRAPLALAASSHEHSPSVAHNVGL